jgi:hypothetical protein
MSRFTLVCMVLAFVFLMLFAYGSWLDFGRD